MAQPRESFNRDPTTSTAPATVPRLRRSATPRTKNAAIGATKVAQRSRLSIAHSIRLDLKFLFLFLKVKSDHSWRFCGHFSDFSPVACGDNLKPSRWTWKIEFWQENIGIELLKTKIAWKLVKFVIQQDLFVLHPSIFEDSMAISLFWHILVILQTREKSLKWPQNLQEWSDFTFKKRRIKYSSSLIEWAIEILGWIEYLAVKNWHLC